jgi:Glycosyltransferase family 87
MAADSLDRSRKRVYVIWSLIGLTALGAWSCWWRVNLQRNVLVGAEYTWIPGWPYLGLDFLNNYLASRHWLEAGDPYREFFGDPLDRKFCYPPLVLPTFAWCAWFSPARAVKVFTVALTVMAAIGVWCACRSRHRLGMHPLPFLTVLAVVLCSTPVLYALERGNYDLVVLMPILLAGWALEDKNWWRDSLAGVALAFATGIKLYPGLLVLSLLPMRRFRAFGVCTMAGLIMLMFHPGDYGQFRANVEEMVAANDTRITHFLAWSMHSLTASWSMLVEPWSSARLTQLPGLAAALAILGPGIGMVCWRLGRCAEPGRVALPFFLWLTAAATFLPPVANDYSLVFLPLAIVATWDRRDTPLVHVAMGVALLWWQPWQLAVGPRLLIVGKIAAVLAVGLSLLTRIREQDAVALDQRLIRNHLDAGRSSLETELEHTKDEIDQGALRPTRAA